MQPRRRSPWFWPAALLALLLLLAIPTSSYADGPGEMEPDGTPPAALGALPGADRIFLPSIEANGLAATENATENAGDLPAPAPAESAAASAVADTETGEVAGEVTEPYAPAYALADSLYLPQVAGGVGVADELSAAAVPTLYSYAVTSLDRSCGNTILMDSIAVYNTAKPPSVYFTIRKCDNSNFRSGGKIDIYVDGSRKWKDVSYSGGGSTVRVGPFYPVQEGVYGSHEYTIKLCAASDPQPCSVGNLKYTRGSRMEDRGSYYTLPFSKAKVRVSRTGQGFKTEYTNLGLTGYTNSEYHPALGSMTIAKRYAIDFGLSSGDAVLAAADGVVKTNDACQVVVQSANGDQVYYIHHRNSTSTYVKVGQSVRRGQQLAVVGGAAVCNAQGAHLHFAIWRGGFEAPVYFVNAAQQTYNSKSCLWGLICPSKMNYVEFRYPKP